MTWPCGLTPDLWPALQVAVVADKGVINQVHWAVSVKIGTCKCNCYTFCGVCSRLNMHAEYCLSFYLAECRSCFVFFNFLSFIFACIRMKLMNELQFKNIQDQSVYELCLYALHAWKMPSILSDKPYREQAVYISVTMIDNEHVTSCLLETD